MFDPDRKMICVAPNFGNLDGAILSRADGSLGTGTAHRSRWAYLEYQICATKRMSVTSAFLAGLLFPPGEVLETE